MKKPRMAAELMGALLEYEFDEVPLRNEYALDVLAHMREVQGVTFYDSAYHVLALRTKGLYLTADSRYLKSAKGKGQVELLDEWQGL
jgi:predicted nucleic acid-binding protein